MKRVYIDTLILEATRRCNLACRHCMRGGQSDKSINDLTIDNLFSQVSSIGQLQLTGGEPFLEPRVIQSVATSIQNSHITLNEWAIITNGTQWSTHGRSFFDYNDAGLNDALYGLSRATTFGRLNMMTIAMGHTSFKVAQIMISDDEYHKEAREKAGISEEDFLRTKSYIEEHANFIGAEFNPEFKSCVLFDMGGATNIEAAEKVIPTLEPTFRYSELPNGNLDIHGVIYIDVDGNVCPMNLSYVEQDKHIWGNINDEPLYDIAKRACEKCNDQPIKFFEEAPDKANSIRENAKEVRNQSSSAPLNQDNVGNQNRGDLTSLVKT